MAKLHPLRITPAPRQKVTVRSGELELTVTPMNLLDSCHASDVANDLISRYITGDETFPAVGGEIITISERILSIAAKFFVIQRPEHEDDMYSPEEFVAFAATMPDEFDDVLAQINQIEVPKKKGEADGA